MKSSVVKDGHHEDALNDLNNSKQNNSMKKKGKKREAKTSLTGRNEVKKRSKQAKKKNEDEVSVSNEIEAVESEEEGLIVEGKLDLDSEDNEGTTTRVKFFENDETVEMTIGYDEFFTDEEMETEKNKNKEKKEKNRKGNDYRNRNEVDKDDVCPGTSGIRNNSKHALSALEKEKGKRDSDSESEEEREIFFNCTNSNDSNSKENGKKNEDQLNLSDFADECDILQPDEDYEEASMRKFVKFLERNRYIKKVETVDSNTKEKQERQKQSRNEGKVIASKVNEGRVESHSQGSASDI